MYYALTAGVGTLLAAVLGALAGHGARHARNPRFAATLLARLPDAPGFASAVPVLKRKSGDDVELNLMVRPPVASLAKFGAS